MILLIILPGMHYSIISRRLLQDKKSPFFGSFTKCPLFQSTGTSFCFHLLHRRGCNISVEVCMSAFRASDGIPSGPATFFDLRNLMVLTLSLAGKIDVVVIVEQCTVWEFRSIEGPVLKRPRRQKRSTIFPRYEALVGSWLLRCQDGVSCKGGRWIRGQSYTICSVVSSPRQYFLQAISTAHQILCSQYFRSG